jgi:predicted RNase H-like nuclease
VAVLTNNTSELADLLVTILTTGYSSVGASLSTGGCHDIMTATDSRAVGVDWSSGTWIAVVLEGDAYDEITTHTHIEEVWEVYAEVPAILIDVPIGLVSKDDQREDGEDLERECDSLARSAIGPRYSSVFTPPAREAAKMVASGDSHSQVSRANREITGKGLNVQAYSISEGIAQVDEFLQGDDRSDERETLFESHPEVCFRGFAGSDLEHPKKTAPGCGERIEALANAIDSPETLIRDITADLVGTSHEIDVDDVLDALALATAAAGLPKQRQSLPSDPPDDATGLSMQIVYRADQRIDNT